MPRNKASSAQPRRLDNQERQRMTWNMGDAQNGHGHGDGAAAEDDDDGDIIDLINDNDENDAIINRQPASIKNKPDVVPKGRKRVQARNEDESAEKRPKVEFHKLHYNLKSQGFFLSLDYHDGDHPPDDDCAFLLQEFTIRPKAWSEQMWDEFQRLNQEVGVRTIRFYYEVKFWYRDELQGFKYFLHSTALRHRPEFEVVPCETDFPINALRLLRQKACFQLTYDDKMSTIRVWIKRDMFANGANGEGVNAIAAAAMRHLMSLVQPETRQDLVDELTKRNQRKEDVPHMLYEDLKRIRHAPLVTDVEHPAIIPVLRLYQKEAVTWLLKREKDKQFLAQNLENPLFVPVRDYRYNRFRSTDPRSQQTYFYNPYGGYFLYKKPTSRAPTYGGILAEEMGLGKTVEMLSLILLNPKEQKPMDDAQPDAQGGDDSATISNESLADIEINPDVACRLEADKAFREKAVEELRYQREKKEMAKRKLVFKKKADVVDINVKCFCGRTAIEVDPSTRFRCPQCDTWQHADCVRWSETASWGNQENYLCPSCRCSKLENAVEAKTTLIVSPASISDQWYAEIKKHVRKGALSVFIYRGVQNEGFVQPHALADYDIVIVAYETLRTELNYLERLDDQYRLRKPRRFANAPSPLAAVKWWRLCLDEAQMVESTLAKAAKMCLRLNATYKWCVTGTPIQKSIDDLYGLFVLLDIDPYSIRIFWEDALYLPYVYNVNRRRLLDVIAPLMWRTSKSDVLDQLNIPEQQHKLRWIDFGAVEEHFYRRTQEECVEQFRQVIGRLIPNQAQHALKLEQLDRQTLEQLLRPLLKLRQACCHPQLVRGGRFINFDQVTQRLRVVTMSDLLEQMIKKTRTECEEFHRAYVSSLNGLAALAWMREHWPEAAEWYREVLRSCEFHEGSGNDQEKNEGTSASAAATMSKAGPKVRTDLLQKLHALYNLNELIAEHRAVIPPTLRDDGLGRECETLKEKYLSQSVLVLEKSRADLETAEAKTKQELEHFLPVWYMRVLRTLSLNEDESKTLIERLQQAMMDTTKWADRFRDINGLLFLLTSHSDQLLEAQQKLFDAIKELLKLDVETVVAGAQTCHLRPNVAAGARPAATCAMCRLEPLFDEYESRLFNFEELGAGAGDGAAVEIVEGVNNEQIGLLGQLRRGTWADSDLEKTLKIVYAYVNRSHRRQLLDQPELLEEAKRHLDVFEVLKQEFRAIRAVWTSLRDHISRRDELKMAIEKLQPMEDHRIEEQKRQFEIDRTVGQNSLKRQIGQLSYLENLKLEAIRRAEQGDEGGSQQSNGVGNVEECPVCTVELGKSWLVLTICGHSLCHDCHRHLTNNNPNVGCRCPVCRRVSPKAKVQEVVFKKPQEIQDEEKQFLQNRIRGNFSAKITDVVRCCLEIKDEEPAAKCLIFSNWLDVLALLSTALTENGLRHVFLSGSGEKFRQQLTEFKTSPRCNIMLLPLKSGANGLNIIEATHVLMVDQSMNPAREQQALGRVHRIGQTKVTMVHRFLIRKTVEEKIHAAFGGQIVRVDEELLDQSQDLAAPSMTVADLMDLFEDENQQ